MSQLDVLECRLEMCANKKGQTILRCTDVLASGTVKKVQLEKMSRGRIYRMAGSAKSLTNRNFKGLFAWTEKYQRSLVGAICVLHALK